MFSHLTEDSPVDEIARAYFKTFYRMLRKRRKLCKKLLRCRSLKHNHAEYVLYVIYLLHENIAAYICSEIKRDLIEEELLDLIEDRYARRLVKNNKPMLSVVRRKWMERRATYERCAKEEPEAGKFHRTSEALTWHMKGGRKGNNSLIFKIMLLVMDCEGELLGPGF
ncbi:MAG: hypothetical protein KC900_09995 [Candidatus Omnitrophica bacterium]|nr:hypothetical protein [Candidatus Omnitrophota bacterium]